MSADQQFYTKALNRARGTPGTAFNLYNISNPQPKNDVTDVSGQAVIIPSHQSTTILQTTFDIEQSPNTAVHGNLLSTGGSVDIPIPEGGGGGTLDRILVEFDVTNNTGAACTLVPAPLIIRNVEIMSTGGSNIIQTISGDHLFTDLAYLSVENLTAFAGYLNTTSELGAPSPIADGATVHYAVPIMSSFLTQSHLYVPALKGGLIFRINFRPASDTVQSGAAPTLSQLHLHLHGTTLPYEQVKTVMDFYRTRTQIFRFTNCVHNDLNTPIAPSGSLSQTLTGMQGLHAGGFMIIRASQTGAGLHTYSALNNGTFDITDSTGHSLLGTPKRGEFNRVWDWQDHFPNTISRTKAIYLIAHAPRIKSFMDNGSMSGFNTYDGNNRLNITTDSSWVAGNYTISLLTKQYAVLRIVNGEITGRPYSS